MSRTLRKIYSTDISGLRTKEAEQLGVIVCIENGGQMTEVGQCKIIDQKNVEVSFLKDWSGSLPDLDMELLALVQDLPGGERLLVGFLLKVKGQDDGSRKADARDPGIQAADPKVS